MNPAAVIFGLQGPKLLAAEKAFFRDVKPWGFILFARNIEGPLQVRALTAALRDCVGRDCFIFIDSDISIATQKHLWTEAACSQNGTAIDVSW